MFGSLVLRCSERLTLEALGITTIFIDYTAETDEL